MVSLTVYVQIFVKFSEICLNIFPSKNTFEVCAYKYF